MEPELVRVTIAVTIWFVLVGLILWACYMALTWGFRRSDNILDIELDKLSHKEWKPGADFRSEVHYFTDIGKEIMSREDKSKKE